MSIARRRAVVMSHAPGLSGMPCCGHRSRAVTRLSCTTSSATSKLPRIRTRAAVSRPASSRKTAATASSEAGRAWFRPLALLHRRPDFDWAARPRLGDLMRLVEILRLDQGEAADHLFRLDEWAVGDHLF